MLAHQLASKLFGEVVRGDVRIMLLSDSPEHCYEPAFMCVAFGAFFRDELARDERSLLRPEIAFVVDRATHFDFAAQRVHATSGKCYGYDHLVIATGCVPSPERIEGLAEAGDHFFVRARAPARRTDRANRARHRVRHRHVSEDAQHAASVRHRADRDHADGRRSAAPPRRARAGRDRLHVSNCLAVAAQLPVPAKADLRRAARTARHRRAAARAADRGPPARRSGRACETRPSDRRPPDRRAPPPCGRAPAAARHRSSQRHARRSSTPR